MQNDRLLNKNEILGVMLGRRKSAKKSPDNNENEKEKADAENRL